MSDAPCYRIPLEHYPGMNRFVLDWMHGDERFLKRGDVPHAGRPVAAPLVNALAESNRKWGLDVRAELDRWATGKTFTVVAGQQVGFGGGPLYTLAKIASLVKMKRDNEVRGNATTVFFWLATEDHDFDEVANIALPNRDPQRQTDLVHLRARRFGDVKQMVGPQPLPETLIAELLRVTNMERPKWLRPGITFAESFAELLTTAITAPFILVDALLPELRHAGAPLLRSILERWHDVQQEIGSRSEELEKAGYTPQVTSRPGEPYTLLFRVDENGRREIVTAPTRAEDPERLSTSALTRPLLQDFVLRPDVFVGGPAEVAYCAQIAPLHDMLSIPMPRIALRGHVLVGPKRIVRHFSKYAIVPEEIFTSPEKILAEHEPRDVGEIKSIAAEAERKLQEDIEKIRQLALPAEHAVARSINRSIGHITYHFRKLTERAIRGLVRKDRERFQAARELVSTFYPDRHVEDRIVAWLPFWLEFGEHLVERVITEVEPDTPFFKIVGL